MGHVKIFDFGLARRVDRVDDQHILTMQVGSLRYMSPECANGDAYGFASDVHSFAILLWEILTLKTAFCQARTESQLLSALGRRRPALRFVIEQMIRQLLRASWHPIPAQRPTFAPIVAQLHAYAKINQQNT